VVVDVRSYPYSRIAPHFNREELDTALCRASTRYLFFGEELGGRPSREEHYDEDGHARYDLMAEPPGGLSSPGLRGRAGGTLWRGGGVEIYTIGFTQTTAEHFFGPPDRSAKQAVRDEEPTVQRSSSEISTADTDTHTGLTERRKDHRACQLKWWRCRRTPCYRRNRPLLFADYRCDCAKGHQPGQRLGDQLVPRLDLRRLGCGSRDGLSHEQHECAIGSITRVRGTSSAGCGCTFGVADFRHMRSLLPPTAQAGFSHTRRSGGLS
jgi:hypothetical protein